MQKIGVPGFEVQKAIHEVSLIKFKQYDKAFCKSREFDTNLLLPAPLIDGSYPWYPHGVCETSAR